MDEEKVFVKMNIKTLRRVLDDCPDIDAEDCDDNDCVMCHINHNPGIQIVSGGKNGK